MNAAFPRRFRPAVHRLEGREVPASFTAASASELIADINAANATPGADTITLVAGKIFTLTAVDNTTDGPTGLPVVAAGEVLTIVGNGNIIERSTAKNTPAFRLLDVAAGASLTLEDLTLQGGLAQGHSHQTGIGGAVYNLGGLTLLGVIVQNNAARGYSPAKDDIATDARGGGVFTLGSLVVTGSTIRNNAAVGGDGPRGNLYSTSFNWGGNGYGGAVYIAGGTVSIGDSTIAGNTARGGTGGDLQGGSSGKPHKGDGWAQGGSWSSTPTGGQGGNGVGGGLYVTAGSAVTLSGTGVTGNAAVGGAGGSGGTDFPDGPAGRGFGGGLCISSPDAWSTTMTVDAYTLAHIVGNTATYDPDISDPAGTIH